MTGITGSIKLSDQPTDRTWDLTEFTISNLIDRVEKLEGERVLDAARIAVLEAEILEMRTGR